MYSAVSVLAGNETVWHLLHMVQFEIMATSGTQITGSLIGDGKALSSNDVVVPML